MLLAPDQPDGVSHRIVIRRLLSLSFTLPPALQPVRRRAANHYIAPVIASLILISIT
jgi:hypothetical protein